MLSRHYRMRRREATALGLGSMCFLVGATPADTVAISIAVANATFALGSVGYVVAGVLQMRLTGLRRSGRSWPP